MNIKDFISNFENFSLEDNGVIVPEYDVTSEHKKKFDSKASDNYEFLADLCRYGYKKLKIKEKDIEGKYSERVKYELEIIKDLSFTNYFLLVWDVVNFCNEKDIPVGPGRGSGAGSLVLFLLGITKIDPIKNGLYFERFISKVRAKKQVIDGVTYLDGSLMCDIDLDICYYRRCELIAYLEKKFKGNVAKILTLTTLTGKVLIKDVGKTFGEKTEEEMNAISDLIEREHGHVQDISIVRFGEKSSDGKVIKEPNDKFNKWCAENEGSYEIALKLRGLIKNEGVHASALAITSDLMDDCCPTKLTGDGDIVTAYDMSVVLLFAVKLDLLGLKSISVIDKICKNLGMKYSNIDPEDQFIYGNLQDLKTKYGLFQIEAPTAYRVCRKVKPKNLEDLSAILAIARPGALQFDQEYADFVKNDRIIGSANTGSKILDDIMAKTGNTVLYQETLMQIANKVFGLSLDEAELIRKCVGKKLRDEMQKWKSVIFEAGKKLNIEKAAEFYWDLLLKSADYSFNKCLSPDERVLCEDGTTLSLRSVRVGQKIKAFNISKQEDHYVTILNKFENEAYLYEVLFSGRCFIEASADHKFLCDDFVLRPLKDIVFSNFKVKTLNGYSAIVQVTCLGKQKTIDLEVDHEDHNFYASEICVSNSHSYSYSTISAITTYLKFKHPQDFFLECLKMAKNEPKPIETISIIKKEMDVFGIKLLQPHLLKSDKEFKKEDGNIRFGLASIKRVSDKSIEKIDNFKKLYSNKFEIFKGSNEAGIPINVLASLIQSGALEDQTSQSDTRAKIVMEAQLWNVLSDKEKNYCMKYGEKFNYDLRETIKFLCKTKDEKGKIIIECPPKSGERTKKSYRIETIKKKYAPFAAIYKQNSENSSFADWFYQNILIGYSLGKTLKEIFKKSFPDLVSINQVESLGKYEKVKIIGVVKEAKSLTSKKNGGKYVRYLIEDESSEISCFLFGNSKFGKVSPMEATRVANDGKMPKEGRIVVVEGSHSGDGVIFGNLITEQDAVIYTRFADFEKENKKEKNDVAESTNVEDSPAEKVEEENSEEKKS